MAKKTIGDAIGTDTYAIVTALREDYYCVKCMFVQTPVYGSIIRPSTTGAITIPPKTRLYTYRVPEYMQLEPGDTVLVDGFKPVRIIEVMPKDESISEVINAAYEIKWIIMAVTPEDVYAYNTTITKDVNLAKQINNMKVAALREQTIAKLTEEIGADAATKLRTTLSDSNAPLVGLPEESLDESSEL